MPHFGSIRLSQLTTTTFGAGPAANDDVFVASQTSKSTAQPSVAQRQKATVQTADSLFDNKLTATEQAQVVQAWLKEKNVTLKVFDGSQPNMDWVNQAARLEGGALAFHLTPDSLMFAEPKAVDPNAPETATESSPFPTEYLKARAELESQKCTGIFISKGSTADDVRHELFHALQFAYGLPSHTGSRKNLDIAQAHRDALTQPVWNADHVVAKVVNSAVYGLKLMGFALVGAPYLLVRRAYESLTGRFKGLDMTQSPGATLRTLMDREAEVSKYMMKRGLMTHFNARTVVSHASYYLTEVLPQTVRSYALDTQWAKAQKS